jgi:ABC-2 type transport system permease protein
MNSAFAQLVSLRLKTLLRNRQPFIFTLALPTFLLFFMTAVWGRYDGAYVGFLLPGLIAMVVLSNALFSIGGDVMVLRHHGLTRRYKITPVGGLTFLGSLIASNLIVVVVQTMVMGLIAIYVYGLTPLNPAQFWLAFLAGTFCLMSLGAVIATASASPKAVTSFVSLIYLPTLFLSGAFFPIDSGPAALVALADATPFRYWLEAMRGSLLTGAGFADHAVHFAVLGVWTAAFLLMGAWRFRWD